MNAPTTLRASSAQRVALCPGSVHAEDGLPERTDGGDTGRGTLVHALIANRYGMIPASLKAAEEAPADRRREAEEIADALIARFEKTAGFAIDPLDVRVLENAVHFGAWEGHPDLVLAHGGALHVVDWKTGWQGTPDAADNAQTRVYAVACAHGSAAQAFTYVVTPGEATVCRYTPADLAKAAAELASIYSAALPANAPRFESVSACRYCRAFGTERCPETQNLPARIPASEVAAFAEKLQVAEADELAGVEETCALIARLHEQVREEIKRRLAADPQAVPGYKLTTGRTTRKVTSTEQAFTLLGDVDQATFLSACRLSLPDLAKALARRPGADGAKVSEAAARRRIDDALAPVIVEEPSGPALARA